MIRKTDDLRKSVPREEKNTPINVF